MRIMRAIISVILLFAVVQSGNSQIITSNAISPSKDAELKYCTGNIDNSNGTTQAGIISAAISFPAIYMASYTGTTIIAVQIGINPNLGLPTNCKTWLAHTLTGERLYEQSFTPVKGWNTIIFDQPYTITQGDLVIGYSCTVNSASNPFGISNNTPNIAHGGHFTMDGNWTTLFENNIDGNYCIVGIVEGETTNIIDLAIKDLKIPQYLRVGEQANVRGTVFNGGNVNITNYKVSYSVNGNQYIDYQVNDINIGQGETHNFSIPDMFYVNKPGISTVDVKISNINQLTDDYDPTNNSMQAEINIYNETVKRRILLEHFTGERCPNCPAAEVALEGWVNHNPDIVWVHNFSGFTPDQYTITWDYCWFYNLSMTYAPAIMIDRTWLQPKNNPGPVFLPEASYTPQLLKSRLETPALLTVNINGSFNPDTRQLDILVSGDKIQNIAGNNPVLTVWLIEDNLPSTQPGVEKHHTVLRQIVSQVFGDKITYNGLKYSKEYSLTLDPKFLFNEMSIVAFVSNYDTINPNNCAVQNAEWVKIEQLVDMPKNAIATINEQLVDITWDNITATTDSFLGYKIWRFAEQHETNPNEWILLIPQPITQNQYTDIDWVSIPSGLYKYAVKAIYNNDISSPPTYTNTVEKPLSSHIINTDHIALYPNPVKDILHIDGNHTSVEIYSQTGQLLITTHNQSIINVESLTPGYYIIKIYTHNNVVVYKIIK